MSFFDDPKKAAQKAFDKANAALDGQLLDTGAESKESPWETLYTSEIKNKIGFPKLWTFNAQDWYKVFDYRFTIVRKERVGSSRSSSALNTKFHFTLPVPPQQVSITPILPEQVEATFGGVVNQTSACVFWNVSMGGVFPVGASRQKRDRDEREVMANKFRESISTSGYFSRIGTELAGLAGKFGNTIDRIEEASQAIKSKPGDYASMLTAGAGAFENALTPPMPYNGSGVDGFQNGYSEAYAMQKFFYIYHALKSEFPDMYQMYFTHFKYGATWKCGTSAVPISFDNTSPNLPRYSLQLKMWDVTPAAEAFFNPPEFDSNDRFGKNGDLRTENVGLQSLGNSILSTAFGGIPRL